MSKSDSNDGSRINLLDSPDLVVRKLKRAKTDSKLGLEFDNPERPEANNLLRLYQVTSGRSREDVANACAGMGYGQFKSLLAEAIITMLSPIQTRYNELISDKGELVHVLKEGAQRASAEAEKLLSSVEKAMGLARF